MSINWSERRAFVTGATGMVGAQLCRWLVNQGAYVAALVMDDDPQSELMRRGTINEIAIVSGRLEERDVVERGVLQHETDTVFHLGAQTLVGQAFHLSRTDSSLASATPELGEHTDDILAGIGYSAAEIAGLRARNII